MSAKATALQIFRFLLPVQEAPVTGVQVLRKGHSGPWTESASADFLTLRGWEFHLKLPLGAGLATKQYGRWVWLQREFPQQIAQPTTLEFCLSASSPIRIKHLGQEWFISLKRNYDGVNLSPYFRTVFRFIGTATLWILLSLGLHIGLVYLARTMNLKPLSWIENKMQEKAPMTFEQEVIERARKAAPIPEEEVLKVKFSYFNGLPWDPMRKERTEAQAGERLDKMLKDLRGVDQTIAFDQKGSASGQEARAKITAGEQFKTGGALKSVMNSTQRRIVPTLSKAKSKNRELSAADLKVIRSKFQKLGPQITLAYQRALAKSPRLSFSLRYESEVDANGYLSKNSLKTSGGSVPAEFLKEIDELFKQSYLGKEFSGVTIQGENIFKSE